MVTGIATFKGNAQILFLGGKNQFALPITTSLPPIIVQSTAMGPLPQSSAKSVFIMLISDFHIREAKRHPSEGTAR